ncbi:MAG: hypothetical protein BGO71_25905 [Burkholderiales bacterium 67-32]|nr:MAG: hypothetical protein BGO71_25905 [Burkholderiales bacterium 67-32]
MVQDHGAGQRGQPGRQRRDHVVGRIQLHVPAQAGHLRGDGGKRPFRRTDVVQAGAFQVDAHAPYAAVVQRPQPRGREAGIDHRDSARPSVHVHQGVE